MFLPGFLSGADFSSLICICFYLYYTTRRLILSQLFGQLDVNVFLFRQVFYDHMMLQSLLSALFSFVRASSIDLRG